VNPNFRPMSALLLIAAVAMAEGCEEDGALNPLPKPDSGSAAKGGSGNDAAADGVSGNGATAGDGGTGGQAGDDAAPGTADAAEGDAASDATAG
jgi:hypothetical protein